LKKNLKLQRKERDITLHGTNKNGETLAINPKQPKTKKKNK